MKNILKQMITDFHTTTIPAVENRMITWPTFQKNIRKAHVFIGMRRSGKTYLMYQHMHQQLNTDINREKLLYINFEDDRLMRFSIDHFQDLLEVYFDMYPQYIQRTDIIFYFDEIHNIPHWEKFIRRLLDKEHMQIYLTGSSAKMLSKEIATSLRGRCWTTEVFPFSFQEYLNYHQINYRQLSSQNLSYIRHHQTHYLCYGGFPESLDLIKTEHHQLLQDYINTAVYRDVIDRYQISNIHVVRLLMMHCLQHLASPLSITKVYHDFKSQGLSLSKNSLYEYMRYFEDAYLLFSVSIYSLSLRKRQVNPIKIYAVDPGLIDAFAIKSSMALSISLENAVFMTLRRITSSIYYYKTINGREVDFLIVHDDESVSLYQVTLYLEAQPSTYEREINALLEASQELSIRQMYIITLNEEKQIFASTGLIDVLPYWKINVSFTQNQGFVAQKIL